MTTIDEVSRPAFGVASRRLAELAAIERLLNTYLREVGNQSLIVSSQDHLTSDMPLAIGKQLLGEGTPFRLQLPASQIAILGVLTYRSAIGHHQFGGALWACALDWSSYWPIESASDLAALLLAELAAVAPEPDQLNNTTQQLLDQIEGSIDKTTRIIEQCYQHADVWSGQVLSTFLAAEQALVFGHPLHPTPKSSEGFSYEDLELYAPEMGASFSLHYVAVAPELIYEDFLSSNPSTLIPALVQREAQRRLRASQSLWALLPCHPWQLRYLCGHPDVQELLDRGQLINLGPLGHKVTPTSSVRTVLEPSIPCLFKLPLNVRITHFIRTNPLEHLQRSMDVSRVVAGLNLADVPSYTILRELGYRTLLPQDWEADCRAVLAASAAVLFRETPPITSFAAPMVLAALLEPDLHSGEPLLIHFVRRAIGTFRLTPEDVGRWLQRYMEIVVLPTLHIFLRHGISLEAHAQNTLIVFDTGWPRYAYVRDLEGASISQAHAEASGWLNKLLPEQSPALYMPSTAWSRLQYYLFVNHLGHLIAALACYGAGEEVQLWGMVRTIIQHYARQWHMCELRSYLDELLDAPTIPAKANLLSWVYQCGETPRYVAIPNPLQFGRLCHG